MKTTLHFPTEQYGFAEIDIEVNEPYEAIVAYNEAIEKTKVGRGIDEKEMNQVIDTMLSGESVNDGIELYGRMNEKQQYTCQALKRALKRVSRE